MNTPAHLVLGAAVFARPPERTIIFAALIGALLPDLSLYVLVAWALQVQNLPPQYVFDTLYFSQTWQSVFAVDNSFVIWAGLLALAVWSRRAWAIALCGAALLHLALDLPLHHDDGRPHFWPITSWVFESPLSYWDSRHGARWIAPAEAVLVVASVIILWRRCAKLWMRAVWMVLLAAELWTVRMWLVFF